MAALNFLTEEIILKKKDNYFVDIYKFNMDITEADIHLQTEETAGSDLLQQTKSRLSLTGENFFITTA